MSETRTDARIEEARTWLNEPEHDIGFDAHLHDDCGAGKAIIDPKCERCAVEIALAAYALSREREVWEEAVELTCEECRLGWPLEGAWHVLRSESSSASSLCGSIRLRARAAELKEER